MSGSEEILWQNEVRFMREMQEKRHFLSESDSALV